MYAAVVYWQYGSIRIAVSRKLQIDTSLSLTEACVPQMRQKGSHLDLDWYRMCRMASFGLLFYGPYQCKWYTSIEVK